MQGDTHRALWTAPPGTPAPLPLQLRLLTRPARPPRLAQIYHPDPDPMRDATVYHYARVIQALPSWTSLLVTTTKPPVLAGRGQPHHCVSSIVASFAKWVTASLPPEPPRHHSLDVLWVSRRRYTSYDGSRLAITEVTRRVKQEEELVLELRRRVAAHNMSISMVDMGGLTLRTTLQLVRASSVMIGVHGAGMRSRPTFACSLLCFFVGPQGQPRRHPCAMAMQRAGVRAI